MSAARAASAHTAMPHHGTAEAGAIKTLSARSPARLPVDGNAAPRRATPLSRPPTPPPPPHSPALKLVRDHDEHEHQARSHTQPPERASRGAAGIPASDQAPAVQSGEAQAVVQRLADLVGQAQFERYFLGQTRLRMREGDLEVAVTSSYLAQILEKRFAQELLTATGATSVRFVVDRDAFSRSHASQHAIRPAGPAASSHSNAPSGFAAPRHGHGHTKDFRTSATQNALRDWVLGDSNKLAHATVRRLVEDERPGAPVFLYGACGVGKTHLLQGAAGLYLERNPGAVVKYVNAEAFTNEYIFAIRQNKVEAFRKQYRGVDLLCLDDVHFFARKEATQTELLHTFDAVGLSGARVILASDEAPRAVKDFSDKLVSRFMACAVVQLQTPDPALRRKLVAHLAQRRGMTLDTTAIETLAQRSERGERGGASVRELEGLLNQVDAFSRLVPASRGAGAAPGQTIGQDVVVRALGGLEPTARTGSHLSATIGASLAAPMGTHLSEGTLRRPLLVRTIIEHVCDQLHVDLHEFAGRGRHKRVVLSRAIVAYLSRKLTTQSFPEIARAMGRPNHSTVITALRRVERDIASDDQPPLPSELAPRHAGLCIRELVTVLHEQLRSVVR